MVSFQSSSSLLAASDKVNDCLLTRFPKLYLIHVASRIPHTLKTSFFFFFPSDYLHFLCLLCWLLFFSLTWNTQAPALDLLLFIIYTTFSVIQFCFLALNILYLYAGISQVYPLSPDLSSELQTSISNCLLAITTCMSKRHLKLNISKTELLILPPKICSLPQLPYISGWHL